MKKLIAFLFLLAIFLHRPAAGFAQGTAFTYQGRLNDGASVANGSYDLQFAIYDAASGGIKQAPFLTNSATAVSNGLFTVTLDFGNVFPGVPRWLDIGVRTNGGGAFTLLTPRQALTATPYAVFAGGASNLVGAVSSANLAGTYSQAVTLNNPGNIFTGNGAGVTNVNAVSLNGLGSGAFWQLGGNNVSAGQFLGSANNQAVEIKANGQRALRLEPNASGAPNVIGGSAVNVVGGGVVGATIGGGGATSYFGSPVTNRVAADFGTIGGGVNNLASGVLATVGGGTGNTASGVRSTIGGGIANVANANAAVVAGGSSNQANNQNATVSGGDGNSAVNFYTTIGGGSRNLADNFGATIGGGFLNTNYGYAAFIGSGSSNQVVSGGWSVIGGGLWNAASGDATVIGGGTHNTAGGTATVVSGGMNNEANSLVGFATVSGGLTNRAIGEGATVGGGYLNTANGDYALVGGGFGNNAGATLASVAGGGFNSIGGYAAHIGGGYSNVVNGVAATVGGGFGNRADGFRAIIGGGEKNSATNDYATVGGGLTNTASGLTSTVGGGAKNVASGRSATVGGGGDINNVFSYANRATGDYSTVGGGAANRASGFQNATVSGGYGNLAGGSSSSVGGGYGNTASGSMATVSGGNNNLATNLFATVAGGSGNLAGGQYSFAAGHNANAIHDGSFVWADSSGTSFTSTTNDQFLIRAGGGVGINTSNPVVPLTVEGKGAYNSIGAAAIVVRNPTANKSWEWHVLDDGKMQFADLGAGATRMLIDTAGNVSANSFITTSDRHAKENFSPVNAQDVLAKVAALPISQWNFKSETAVQHVGPMAQDFRAAFGLGTDERHIATVDADGVALAAIQGLNQKLEQTRADLKRRDAENAELKARLEKLEALFNQSMNRGAQ